MKVAVIILNPTFLVFVRFVAPRFNGVTGKPSAKQCHDWVKQTVEFYLTGCGYNPGDRVMRSPWHLAEHQLDNHCVH